MSENAEATAAMEDVLQDAVKALYAAGKDGIKEVVVTDKLLRLSVSPQTLSAVAPVLHDHPDLRLTYPADLFATDLGDRILLTYRLWSLETRLTALVLVEVPYEPCEVPSIVHVWPGLDWFERECFDMFGVVFVGHPRADNPARMRILLSEDWEGHPFRKDYTPRFTGDPLHGPQETN